MRKATVGFLVFLFSLPCAAPPRVSASLGGESRTYLNSWESLDSERHFSLYEYVDLDVGLSRNGGLSLHLGGWGRVDLGQESYGDSTNGEFQFGYLDYAHDKADATVRVGRLAVSEGVALHETLDGLYVRGGLPLGFSLALYGGVPLETDDDGRGSDLLYGGRLGFSRPGLAAAGVSYLREESDGARFREEIGVDFFLRPAASFRLEGSSAFNNDSSVWMDHDYRIVLGPFGGLSLTGEFQSVDYESYFQSATNSAFFSPVLDTGETATIVGAEIEYELMPRLALAASYRNYGYDTMESADSFGGRLSWNGDKGGAGLSYLRMEGAGDELRYSRYRAFIHRRFALLDLTLDALDVVYDEKVNGVGDAYAVVASLGRSFTDRLRVTADFEYGSNPIFEDEVKFFLKLLWRFPSTTALSGEESK